MVMINLMEGDYAFAGNPTLKIYHSDDYNKTYNRMLEDLVGQRLNLQAASRPSLTQLIALTGHGLTQWEKANVKVDGQEVPAFANMTFPDEEFQIGDEAPERMGGPKPNVKMDGPKPKKRKAEENLADALQRQADEEFLSALAKPVEEGGPRQVNMVVQQQVWRGRGRG
jgi:hypothetical protein